VDGCRLYVVSRRHVFHARYLGTNDPDARRCRCVVEAENYSAPSIDVDLRAGCFIRRHDIHGYYGRIDWIIPVETKT
jgi:hypothetical protein